MCVWGSGLKLPSSECGFSPIFARFHGRIPRFPRQELSLSPFTLSLPLIPLFRSRRFNPGFSTQFGALHGGLYASARLTRHILYVHIHIHSLTLLSLATLPSRAYYLRILRTRRNVYAKTHIHVTPTYIPDRLASFYSVRPRSLASKDRYTPSALFFPVLLSSFSLLLLFPLLRLRILPLSLLLSVFILCRHLRMSIFLFIP